MHSQSPETILCYVVLRMILEVLNSIPLVPFTILTLQIWGLKKEL